MYIARSMRFALVLVVFLALFDRFAVGQQSFDRIKARVISQKEVGAMGCGPCTLFNALRNGGPKHRAAADSIPGKTSVERVNYLASKFGGVPSKIYHGKRTLYSVKHGTCAEDLVVFANAALEKLDLPEVAGRWMNKVDEEESQLAYLRRVHQTLSTAIKSGFPPMIEIRSYSANTETENPVWNGLFGHWLAAVNVQPLGEQDSGFVIDFADSLSGRVVRAYASVDLQRKLAATRGFTVGEEDGKEKWFWVKGRPYVLLTMPELNLGTSKRKWHERTFKAITYVVAPDSAFEAGKFPASAQSAVGKPPVAPTGKRGTDASNGKSNVDDKRHVHASGVGIARVFPKLRFSRPVFLTHAGDGSNRIFVVEQDGIVRQFSKTQAYKDSPNGEGVDSAEVFLDIKERISRKGNEEGLIGFAFHPNFKDNGEVFVHYSSSVEDMHGIVSRFQLDPDNPNRIDPESEQQILKQKQPYRNHNGGTIAFGSDGMLYISFGDGGSLKDPHRNGQNMTNWMGAMLRIDIDNKDAGKEYAVPKDNPWVDHETALPELFAIGLRNVWRFSIDRETGEIWAGDVGQDLFDEVSLIKSGRNYGWNRWEAHQDFEKETEMAVEGHEAPVTQYGREWGKSITGGNVYRGKDFPELTGSYFYGDYMSGNMWRVTKNDDGTYANELVRRTGRSIASFGEDQQGEVYLCSFDGGIYRIVPSDQPENTFEDWPKKLSETDLFASIKEQKMAEDLFRYEVNAPFWSDGVDKDRFVRLPKGGKMRFSPGGTWKVPVGTTIVKSFHRGKGQRWFQMLETRLIKRTDEGWESATYVWDRGNGDATLHPEGKQFEVWWGRKNGGVASWHAPSSSECASCHVDAAGYVLGLKTAQLNRDVDGTNQIVSWAEKGLLENLPPNFAATPLPAYCDPYDEDSADLETRARVWLDVNCAMCHQPNGPGNAAIDLRKTTSIDQARMVGEKPAQGSLGIENGLLVCPGDASRSLLLHRVETLGAGRMPNIGSNRVDEKAVKLLRDWIESMKE